MLPVRWKKASVLTCHGASDFRTLGRIFFAVCIRPLAQRACWALKPFMSTGSSEAHSICGRYRNFQPLSCERYERSESSVRVSCCQTQESSMDYLRQTPAVPLILKKVSHSEP